MYNDFGQKTMPLYLNVNYFTYKKDTKNDKMTVNKIFNSLPLPYLNINFISLVNKLNLLRFIDI